MRSATHLWRRFRLARPPAHTISASVKVVAATSALASCSITYAVSSWTLLQPAYALTSSDSEEDDDFSSRRRGGASCRVCAPPEMLSSMRAALREAETAGIRSSSASSSSTSSTSPHQRPATATEQRLPCPADSAQLGHATWTFLHTMAAYYPETPSQTEQQQMQQMIKALGSFYPCEECASHLRQYLQHHPPSVQNRSALSQWFCEMHNEVNQRLGKPTFDCQQADQRWFDEDSHDCIETQDYLQQAENQ